MAHANGNGNGNGNGWGGIPMATDRGRATLLLRRRLGRPDEVARLRRRLFDETSRGDLGRLSDHEVVDLLAARAAISPLGLSRAPGRLAPVSTQAPRAAPEPEVAEEPPAPIEDAKTWLAVLLTDMEGNPLPGERVRVELRGGRTEERTLDGDGEARFPGIEEGECRVTFPDLDREAWEAY